MWEASRNHTVLPNQLGVLGDCQFLWYKSALLPERPPWYTSVTLMFREVDLYVLSGENNEQPEPLE